MPSGLSHVRDRRARSVTTFRRPGIGRQSLRRRTGPLLDAASSPVVGHSPGASVPARCFVPGGGCRPHRNGAAVSFSAKALAPSTVHRGGLTCVFRHRGSVRNFYGNGRRAVAPGSAGAGRRSRHDGATEDLTTEWHVPVRLPGWAWSEPDDERAWPEELVSSARERGSS